jgi:H+/gluconate symporter-like permease
MMYELIIVLMALCLLMLMAYRGFSVILCAPLVAMGAVFLTDPQQLAPMFSQVFMEKMAGFVKLYFPVFILGAIFGKFIEISGFSKSIVSAIIRWVGTDKAILATVLVCAVLTYGGVSLFVVVFAVYPFAAEMFRQLQIPKRLIPGTIALGAFTFTMDALPGTPQIQNIIPSSFFNTNAWAAPWLGIIGSLFIFISGLFYLEYQRKKAFEYGEGYGTHLKNEPESVASFDGGAEKVHPFLALVPLMVVAVMNRVFTMLIPIWYGHHYSLSISGGEPIIIDISKNLAIWSIEGALILGIVTVIILAWRRVWYRFSEGVSLAISGALLATMNTASEYGFGAIIAALPGFILIADGLKSISNPLVHQVVTVTALAGITGSASGGLSIALATMSEYFIAAAHAAHIPMEVLHRLASMASGGMDTLPHNGAVITLLAVTGLSHKDSYRDIFAITILKTVAVFVVIACYSIFGIV